MIPIKQIVYNRAEGRAVDCGPRTFETWDAVDKHVRNVASLTAPSDYSYHKCDVTLTWLDGTTYTFRHDLEYGHGGIFNPVSNDFANDLAFYSGQAGPDDVDDRAAFLNDLDEMYPGRRELAIKILAEYDTGRVSTDLPQ